MPHTLEPADSKIHAKLGAKSFGLLRVVVALLLMASATEFVVRVPLRFRHTAQWNDFLSPYIQSRAWLRGHDPYDSQSLIRFWPTDLTIANFVIPDSTDGSLVRRHGIPSPYPPTTFVVLAPLACLSWKAVQWVWISINFLMAAAMLLAVGRLAEIPFSATRGWLFLALCLGLAPLHTGLAAENVAIVGIGLSLVALWLSERGWDGIAGVLIAVSICLKPPIGLCFLFFYLVSRRWRIAAVACGSAAIVTLAAAARMWVSGTAWVQSYRELMQAMFAPGGINDFTSQNPVWFHMLNLQGPLYALARSQGTAGFIALGAGIVFLGLWTSLKWSKRDPGRELLEVSALVVMSLLPVYHRFYDASLLILPIAWALSPRTRAGSRITFLTVVLIAPFLIPGAVIFSQISNGSISQRTANSNWWNAFVIGHEAWALLLLTVLLLYAMQRKSSCEPHSLNSMREEKTVRGDQCCSLEDRSS